LAAGSIVPKPAPPILVRVSADLTLDAGATETVGPALERELESRRKDAPLVEDCPLHAEEETPDFQDLRMLLQLRTVRAHEHWKGNTEVTLMDIVKRVVEQMEPM